MHSALGGKKATEYIQFIGSLLCGFLIAALIPNKIFATELVIVSVFLFKLLNLKNESISKRIKNPEQLNALFIFSALITLLICEQIS